MAKVEAMAPITSERDMQLVTLPMHVPGWVRFIARQPNGEWWGFQNEPSIVPGKYYPQYSWWKTEEGGETCLLSAYVYVKFPTLSSWRDSLVRLEVG